MGIIQQDDIALAWLSPPTNDLKYIQFFG